MAISKVTRGKGTGNVFTPQQLAEDLAGLADIIRNQMFLYAQTGRKHSLLKRGGFIENSKVTLVPDGVKFDLPQYAQWMDQGRKAGVKKIPVSVIEGWIKRYRVGGRDSRGRFKMRQQSTLSLAYAIQQAIYKNGIKPRPFIQKSLEFGEQLLANYIEETLFPQLLSVVEFAFEK